MNRFIQDNAYMSLSMPDTFTELKHHIPTYRKDSGSLLETSSDGRASSDNAPTHPFPAGFSNYCLNFNMHVMLPNSYTRQLFAPQDVSLLCELYTKLYFLTSISQVEVCSAYKKIQNSLYK